MMMMKTCLLVFSAVLVVADSFTFAPKFRSTAKGALFAEWKKKEAMAPSGGPAGLGTIPVTFKVPCDGDIL
jgi:hypothetical protein